MSEDNTSRSSRRKFLKIGGATLFAGSVGSAVATRPESKLPVQASGKTIRRYVPKGEYYELREQFVSAGLRARYGTKTVTFDPEAVPRESIPDEYLNPDRGFVVQYDETATIGSPEQHASAEAQLKGGDSDGVSTMSATYDGPLYVYKSGTAAQNDDASKRTGPINVNWTDSVNKSVSEIKQYMKNRGWTACCAFYSGTRYVLDNGSPKGQDTHIYNEIDWTKQYHVRAYEVNVSDSLGTAVVGQVHRDPHDHNKIGSVPWYFNESRDAVKSDWESWGYDSQYYCTCATQWGSHDGNLSAIS